MISEKKMLPVGIENFEQLIKENFYFIDKTGMIAELIRNRAKVNLFTRPRRFGKSLNMSMLRCFFEAGRDPSVFDGFAILKETEICREYMGKFPVISISLKDISADDYEGARRMLASVIGFEALKYSFLLKSERLEEGEKAFYGGYYDQMVRLIRSMFSQALKTNDSLAFAVLTGCLRISRESVFTGMNNLCVMTVADEEFSDCFGFTDREVRELLKYYELDSHYEAMKAWYDGYCFGSSEIYCPWNVVSYVRRLLRNSKAKPENFWANSSGNDAVREFVRRLDVSVTARELERLTAGETVPKEIRPELTYREMYSSVENLWSLLYMTGYLTKRGVPEGRVVPLTIPNMEIRDIFKTQILTLFKEQVSQDGAMVREFCSALKEGNVRKVEELFGLYLRKTVSIRDTFVKQSLRENFYHGILLGILSFKGNWYVTSNYETGDGYGDILIETEDDGLGIIIEVKYARDGNMEKGVQQALKQIRDRRYDEKLYDDGIEKVKKYGIACYKKRCRVALEKVEHEQRRELK